MVALVDRAASAEFAEAVRVRYQQVTGNAPDVYPVSATAGAGLLEEEYS
jgi:hypothetical protein